MNEILNILTSIKDTQKLEERFLELEPNKDSCKAAYHRGSIAAYNDVIRRFTK